MLPSSAEDLSSSLVPKAQNLIETHANKLDSPLNSTIQPPKKSFKLSKKGLEPDSTYSSSLSGQHEPTSKLKTTTRDQTEPAPLSDLPLESVTNSNIENDQDDCLECASDYEPNALSLQAGSSNLEEHYIQNDEQDDEDQTGKSDNEDDDEDDDDDQLGNSDEEPRPPSPPQHGGLNYHQVDRIEFNLIQSESDSDESLDDALNSSSDLIYSSLPGKAPASKAPRKTAATKTPAGRGKSAGKGSGLAPPLNGKIEPPSEKQQPTSETSKPGKGKGKSSGKGKHPTSKTELPSPVKERRKIQCVTPPGAELGTATQKPPYTYASLITQALAAQADEDGKMLVSEMCEWMAGVYPFYAAKEKGSDWQSAVRHNLNADKRFKRIERMPTDGGKGNFWTLKTEEWANFDGLELRRPKNEVKTTTAIQAEIKTTFEPPKTETNIANLRTEGVPSRSISSIARSDIGAHHRTAASSRLSTTSPSRALNSQGIRPPPPTPILQDTLPVFSANEPSQHDPLPTDNLAYESMNMAEPDCGPDSLQEAQTNDSITINSRIAEKKPALDIRTKTAVETTLLPTSIPPIDPNLLACSASVPTSVRHPSAAPSSPAPAVGKSKTSSLTSTGKAKTGIARFQIVIQEPTRTSTSAVSGTPKTQEELKRLIESEPPMYTEGNKLILNKLIFKELKPSQISSLEKLGAQSAVKILQKFIIGYFKEKIKKSSSTTSQKDHHHRPSGSTLGSGESDPPLQSKAGGDASLVAKRKTFPSLAPELDSLPITHQDSQINHHPSPNKKIKLQPG